MKNWMKIAIGIVIAVVILVVPFASSYNGLVSSESEVDAQWAKVESKLQRRYDLIPNLVNSVKGSMTQEKEVFGKIADARSKLSNASTTDDKVQANNELDSAVSRLLVVVENYPDLKSDKNVQALMDELAGTENRISTERDRYNDTVKTYNNKVKRFPGSIVAKMSGFDSKTYFKAVEGAQNAPSVNFDTK
ncbi:MULTISPECIES: LemA family protein [Carnobacterium]|uniref:LemA family protein n=1 Tax=Carnobacterium TaxID=2747 RepID=UPI001072D73F|nr:MULTISPECIES: LemA family protein [Carnobacterium]MDT1938769.1 LemA family protein [Carnobacterium divergens]MDT1941207.1 LemA family protein [Carnobacterium divergens]MDT1947005.1 LemA family protein [Carnobacterium divergens]MDT1949442.1 LemA family protein [Carnobacterium divergens]MDT1954620.1 LemA family protein [Carnobacterium divergens]